MAQLYIVPEGGVANRMRAVASGVALARRTRRKPVVVWHRDSGLNARFGDVFRTDNLPFELKETGDARYYLQFEQPRKSNLYLSAITALIDGKLRIFQNVNNEFISDEKEIERIVTDLEHDVIIKSGLIFHPISQNLLNDIFHYNENVAIRIQELIGTATPDYALQIRRTDNRNSIANSPIEAFERIAIKLIRENNDVKIFLATDDELTKLYFQKKFPHNIIYNKAEASRNTRDGIIDAVAELYIMASCRHIYGSYWSSYSEIASLIGGSPLTVVKR